DITADIEDAGARQGPADRHRGDDRRRVRVVRVRIDVDRATVIAGDRYACAFPAGQIESAIEIGGIGRVRDVHLVVVRDDVRPPVRRRMGERVDAVDVERVAGERGGEGCGGSEADVQVGQPAVSDAAGAHVHAGERGRSQRADLGDSAAAVV